MAKVTGVGGVFLKCRGDSAGLAAWYRKHLGMPLEDFGGAILRWPDDKAEDRGLTVWHLAEKDSQWFSPSKSSGERAGSGSASLKIRVQFKLDENLPESFVSMFEAAGHDATSVLAQGLQGEQVTRR